MKKYLQKIDDIKNNYVNSLEQHWQYLKDKVVYTCNKDIDAKQMFLNSNFSLHLSFKYLKQHIKCEEEFDFYLRQKSNNRYAFVVKLLNNNKQDVYDKCKIICPRCHKEYIINKQQKLYFRRQHLFCGSCICYYAQTIGGGQEKFENTMIEKYGVRRPIQVQQIRNKTEKTMNQRYGANFPLQSNIIKKKIADTMMQRYNVVNPFDSDFFQNKCKETLKNKYGDSNVWKTDITKKIFNSGKCCVSKVSYDFFKQLAQKIDLKCEYGENQKKLIIDNKVYFLDFYIQQLNLAIEFQGDYFHGNPQIYNENDMVSLGKSKKTAKEMWEIDKNRKNTIENFLKCTILYVWQRDVRQNQTLEINKIIGIINDIKLNKGDQKV